MTTHYKPIIEGHRFGIHYNFEHAGECIPMHKHKVPELTHTVACLKGAVHVFGPGLTEVVQSNQELLFDSSEEHEIEALEDDTEITNFFLKGKPSSYTEPVLAQLSGSCNFTRSRHLT